MDLLATAVGRVNLNILILTPTLTLTPNPNPNPKTNPNPNQVGRVNLNTQCGRSPDELPFSGRRSSALGTMSVSEALRAFSTETLVAGKATQQPNPRLAEELPLLSKFMRAV